MIPSSDKINLDHFVHDLQKYKPWLSSKAWDEWENFVANSKQLSELSCNRHEWELPVLVSAAVIASHAHSQHLPEPLSDETARLMEKETAVPTKVQLVRIPQIQSFI